jgi:mannosyltransferase OCH1-like enzyme
MNLNFTSDHSYNKLYSSGIYNYTKKKSNLKIPTLMREKSISNLKNNINTPNVYSNNNSPNNLLINCDELFREIEIDNLVIDESKIPKYVFQTWKNKLLTNEMKNNILKLRDQHKDFTFFLYDDEMCIDFLKKHFNKLVLDAFNSLIPGPFKADLWRYCVLYKYGGVYMDIKLNCINGFNLNNIIHEECYPKDIPRTQYGIWQGMLICKPNNMILKKCIDCICMHVKYKFYGKTFLSVTGPHLMFNILVKYNNQHLYKNSKMKLVRKNKILYLYYNNKPVINFYKEWYHDRGLSEGPRYGTLWDKRDIYK